MDPVQDLIDEIKFLHFDINQLQELAIGILRYSQELME